ncbi:MAG: hypothetical protein FJX59_09645 [Alphaproteobacteria bacterium]|nr:hypothetical protein [Alphaproteobacteria bacterium]
MRYGWLLMALVIAGCGAVPQPFRGTAKVTSDLAFLDVPSAVGIAVVPVRGAPDPFNGQLTAAVAAELERREIPSQAVTENRGLGFSLVGKVSSADIANGQASLAVRWTLRSRRGADSGSYTQRFSVRALEWREGGIEAANRMGRDAAEVVVAMIEGSGSLTTGPATADRPPPQPPSATPTYAKFSVRPVEGAPGDGREALQAALAQALAAKGIKRDDVSPDVILIGRVDVTPSGQGKDFVEIAWRAITQDGRDLGEAKLTNTIPRGALSNRWGPTALTIADATLPDIMQLLAAAPRF